MRVVKLSIAFCAFLGALNRADPAELSSHSSTNAAVALPILLPTLALPDETGRSIPLFSIEAYQAEFKYLRNRFHEIDLKGPAVETDGWTHNIAEAEWPFMSLCYFGYACANLAIAVPDQRTAMLAEMRWLIDALQTQRMSGFVSPHFGPPFGTGQINASVFVHGHFLNLAIRYREVSGDPRYDAIIHRIATLLNDAYISQDAGVLKSYRDMWWISDNLPALSALARYDRLFHHNTRPARDKFLNAVKRHYLDSSTGLLCTYVDADAQRQIQGPRGISTMYGLHFLRDVDPDFATDQFSRARKHLVREFLGLGAVREFPEGSNSSGDIDSGPLVFGLGPSASGFAIAAAAVMRDDATANTLLKALALAGMPEFKSGALTYTTMPPVGQAVILFGKTELLKNAAAAAAKH